MLDDYVGIPFREKGRGRDGCDCWGLLALVYRMEIGIDLPSYAEHYASTADSKALAGLIAGELGPWRAIAPGIERPFDGVLMTEAGVPRHVGIVAAPGFVLHVENGGGSIIESYRARRLERRIAGFWRHHGMDGG